MRYIYFLFLLLSVPLYVQALEKIQTDSLSIYVEASSPYAYLNENGEPEGVYVDLVDSMFIDVPLPHRVVLRDSISHDFISEYSSCIVPQNVWSHLQESSSYSRLLFHSSSGILHNETKVIKQISDFHGYRIGVMDKDLFIAQMCYFNIHIDKDKIYAFHTIEEALELLESNKCELVIADYLLLYWYLDKHSIDQYYLSELTTLPCLYKLYISDKYPKEIIDVVNTKISEFCQNGRVDNIFYQWFGHPHQQRIHHARSRLDIALVVLSTLILMLILSIYFLYYKAKRQRRSLEDFTNILMKLPHGVDIYIDQSKLPAFRNQQSVRLEEMCNADPNNVYIKEEHIRFPYKKKQLHIVVKINITELEEARQAANRSSKLKTQFLANTSHDIRSPLNAIVGFASLMSECENEEEMAEYASIIELNTNNLLHLIEEIIDLSKLQTDVRRNRQVSKYDLYKSLKSIHKEYMLFLEKKKKTDDIKFEVTTNFDQLVIMADPARVYRVLSNILSNSCKYTEKGTIHLHVEYNPEVNEIRVTLSDTGAGISPEKLDKLFSNKDVHDKNMKGSFGLGLDICKAILDHVNGSIDVASTVGQGTTVTIVFKPKIVQYNSISPE